MDTWCHLEDLLGTMSNDKKVKRTCVIGMLWWWWLPINKYKSNNPFIIKLIFFWTKIENYPTKTDIIGYHLSPNSTALKLKSEYVCIFSISPPQAKEVFQIFFDL